MHAHKICRSHETERENKSFNEKKQNLKKHLDRLSGELDLTKSLAEINVNISLVGLYTNYMDTE